MREIYQALKNYLDEQHAWLDDIDVDYGQYRNQNGQIRTSPMVFIGFQPIVWSQQLENVQRAVLSFDITLVSQTAYGDDQDLEDTNYIDHWARAAFLFSSLHNCRFRLSDVPGMEALADTDDDRILMESIVRTQQGQHNVQRNLITTSDRYQTTIFDYYALKDYTDVLAELELDAQITSKSLTDETLFD